MMRRCGTVLAAGVLVCVGACSQEQKAKEQPAPVAMAAKKAPFTIEDSAVVSLNSKVKSVDYATRRVVLEDGTGDTMEFVAGDAVKRLNEVHAGDTVKVECVVSLRAEVRPPTAEESADPVAAIGVAGRAPASSVPAAGAARGLRVVTTVTAIDVPNMLVTLRGPMGDTTTVKARHRENVDRLSVGDTIVLFYSECVAVSVEKN